MARFIRLLYRKGEYAEGELSVRTFQCREDEKELSFFKVEESWDQTDLNALQLQRISKFGSLPYGFFVHEEDFDKAGLKAPMSSPDDHLGQFKDSHHHTKCPSEQEAHDLKEAVLKGIPLRGLAFEFVKKHKVGD
jgi:hypothetical protein